MKNTVKIISVCLSIFLAIQILPYSVDINLVNVSISAEAKTEATNSGLTSEYELSLEDNQVSEATIDEWMDDIIDPNADVSSTSVDEDGIESQDVEEIIDDFEELVDDIEEIEDVDDALDFAEDARVENSIKFSDALEEREIIDEPLPYLGAANCYSYAFKQEYNYATGDPYTSKPQPGGLAGQILTIKDLEGTAQQVKKNIEQKVFADMQVLGYTFTEVDSPDHITKSGNWLVALAHSSGNKDYHWYRRNANGLWSHKLGVFSILYVDNSFDLIKDPAECNRGIYDEFLGYYEVGPNK